MINLNNKKFRAISNTDNGELSKDFIFHYKQTGNVLTCLYKGEEIVEGQLLGVILEDNSINIRYQQINIKGEIRTGICQSKIIVQASGKIRIEENWQWTSGNKSKGFSVLEEC